MSGFLKTLTRSLESARSAKAHTGIPKDEAKLHRNNEKPTSLKPLKFDEAVSDLLKGETRR
jgi:hypothetical protein